MAFLTEKFDVKLAHLRIMLLAPCLSLAFDQITQVVKKKNKNIDPVIEK